MRSTNIHGQTVAKISAGMAILVAMTACGSGGGGGTASAQSPQQASELQKKNTDTADQSASPTGSSSGSAGTSPSTSVPGSSGNSSGSSPATPTPPIATPTPPPPASRGEPVTPEPLDKTDVSISINTFEDLKGISPWIYGVNEGNASKYQFSSFNRLGGNRWSTFNWENNASNGGADWMHQNDATLGVSNVPGDGVSGPVALAQSSSVATLVTIPILGYVAADKKEDGDVNKTPNYLDVRFRKTVAFKNAPFSLTPDLADANVYQDEFVNWLESKFPVVNRTAPVFYSLDNEPDLWTVTHPRIRKDKLTYGDLIAKNIEFARAVKSVAPNAVVFGAVNYGFAGMYNLQGATDAANRNFTEAYLAEMKKAEAQYGKRLVDVYDFHWYPESMGSGKRIIDNDISPASIEARVQAPRSLWDKSYSEDSWIAKDVLKAPIALLPDLEAKVAKNYPGTKLAISEYNYGAGNHISGGLAQADTLGVYGREGVFAANLWEMNKQNDFFFGAFRLFRNYDGKAGKFGDISVKATTSDVAKVTAYGSLQSTDSGKVVAVVINKTAGEMSAGISLVHDNRFSRVHVYRMTSASAVPQDAGEVQIDKTNAFVYKMPAYSASTLVFE